MIYLRVEVPYTYMLTPMLMTLRSRYLRQAVTYDALMMRRARH
eukprot:COSAG01_NODE_399_length_17543_cov_15.077792_7_plen_43_part_00